MLHSRPSLLDLSVDELDYSRLEGVETYFIEVVTPFLLEPEYPETSDQPVPWWWAENREEKILEQREAFRLQTVDHRQVVTYEGGRPVETAKSGTLWVGSPSKYGFVEP